MKKCILLSSGIIVLSLLLDVVEVLRVVGLMTTAGNFVVLVGSPAETDLITEQQKAAYNL